MSDTGGPAFPKYSWDRLAQQIKVIDGMTLRDYFAAKAMASYVNDVEEQKYWAREYTIEEMFRFTANRAYAMADAMLKAREQ